MVIVTTIQKLGLALDETSRRNKQNRSQGKATYKEQHEPRGTSAVMPISVHDGSRIDFEAAHELNRASDIRTNSDQSTL